MSALDVQVGGDHYKKYKIQPMEYSMANGLDACQHTAIKYITRFRDKGGIADLEKAKHCIDMLIEFERAGQVETTSLDSTERTFEKAAASVNSPTVPKGYIRANGQCPVPPLPGRSHMIFLLMKTGRVVETAYLDALNNENWDEIEAYRFLDSL